MLETLRLSCVQANAVFVHTTEEILEGQRERGWKFYTFIGGAARFMFSRDSKLERIDELCCDLRLCAIEMASRSERYTCRVCHRYSSTWTRTSGTLYVIRV
jgi:hypothetical protein